MDADLSAAELWRRLANLVRHGVVAEADYDAARVRVQVEDLLTGWLPWAVQSAGPDITWWAPEVGEQVVLIAPSGDLSQAIVMASLYYRQYPAPERAATVRRVEMGDGAVFEYDRDQHKLSISLPGDAQVSLEGSASVQAAGPVEVSTDGDATVIAKGSLEATTGGDASVTATGKATVEAAAIELNGAMGQVVTTAHTCAFTGNPHPAGSSTVSAGV
ncbi:phage baseplate assembly protein V [Halorhodospira neutriphila]|uniref:Gp5/Type VI secretion system Vgr protein OB-fold domain-containing protein n=1 Tax=Halorhodospira neutriphila TaxID=168379 RepID=A0ABS1E4F5_9GAMM|nr:phage baseplate assembly protein V [Halorhodospira neutriphila]MBK1725714.1 hypothetical protein [Halorhodospira neutriphila]